MVLSEAIRFVSSELGNRSEVASLSALEESTPRTRCAMIQPSLVPSLRESAWGIGADVELAGGTVVRYAPAVHRR